MKLLRVHVRKQQKKLQAQAKRKAKVAATTAKKK